MITLSIRILDDMAERLKTIAKVRDISLNKLMFELSTQVLAEEDAKHRFLAAQLRGDPKRAIRLLDELARWGFRKSSAKSRCHDTTTWMQEVMQRRSS